MNIHVAEQVEIIQDRQKYKVYHWEGRNVAPHDRTPVPFDQIQSIVDYVWKMEGLKYPPKVMPMPTNIRKYAGDATRTTVRFKGAQPTHVILHELAHSLSSDINDASNHHGSLFMGLFIQLLSRYLHLDYVMMVDTAKDAGLHVKLDARPVFL